MPIQIVSLSCDPPRSLAGLPFKLTVELESPASTDLTVSLENNESSPLQAAFPRFGRPGRNILPGGPTPSRLPPAPGVVLRTRLL